MQEFRVSDVESAGLDPDRWNDVLRLAQRFVDEGRFATVAFQSSQNGLATPTVRLGLQNCGDQSRHPVQDDALFLVASLTKPVLAAGVLKLVEQGEISLTDRASTILPEFRKHGKHLITVHHLLSHTSGLPDQLPNNLELRQQQASLDEFYSEVCELELDYPLGTSARYQSMGYLVLDRIVERVAGMTSRDFLAREIFESLGMTDTQLGIDRSPPNARALLDRVVRLESTGEIGDFSDVWNTEYWLGLGAPWGGMISTPADMNRFCTMVAHEGRFGCEAGKEVRILDANSVWASRCNQLECLPGINEHDRTHRPWGLGWRLNWLGHRQVFCDLLPRRIIGHWGATGCLMWVDTVKRRSIVICTSRPLAKHPSEMIRLSNALATAFR